MLCDFHTHHPGKAIPELVSTPVDCDDKYTSLELHPWNLPETYSPLPETIYASLQKFNALGEIGLDRLRGPSLTIQQQYLRELLQLAADCRKPVVFHCVRAFPELFSLLKNFPCPWAIHGFRGKFELLDEIWLRGGIVSLHPSVANNMQLHSKLRVPQGKFAFESDDDPHTDLAQIIDLTMKQSGNPDLLKISYDTFMEFVNYA